MPDLFSTSETVHHSRRLTYAAANVTFKITALNVQNFGEKRLDVILEYLVSSDADILVLTEIKNKKASRDLLYHLGRLGYLDIEIPDHGPDAYHTIILRSVQGKRLEVTTESLKSRSAILRVMVGGCDPLYLVGLYAPAFNEKNTQDRQSFFRDLDRNIFARLAGAGKYVLAVGDLNMVEARFHDHLPEFVEESREHFTMLARYGMNDVVRSSFADTPKYTWVSPRTGQGQRLDHVFASKAIESWIELVEVDDIPRTSGISDHSALHISICAMS